MADLSGVFIGEGSSDEPLARLVADVFASRGLEADIRSLRVDWLGVGGRTIAGKIEIARQLYTEFDFLVIHRDCDNREPSVRLAEIDDAVTGELGADFPCIPLVPRTMTEAWLLLNESAIRKAAGKPNSRVQLALPRMNAVESVRDPKKLLQEVLLSASEETGRRRNKLASKFNSHRRSLLEKLDHAALEDLPSWQHTIDKIDSCISRLGPTTPANS